jgi:hypothetical protein
VTISQLKAKEAKKRNSGNDNADVALMAMCTKDPYIYCNWDSVADMQRERDINMTQEEIEYLFAPVENDMAYVVFEKFVRIMKCSRCRNHGVADKVCSKCSQGHYNVPVKKTDERGFCRQCRTVGKLRTPHKNCPQGQGFFLPFDPDFVDMGAEDMTMTEQMTAWNDYYEVEVMHYDVTTTTLFDSAMVFFYTWEEDFQFELSIFLKFVATKVFHTIRDEGQRNIAVMQVVYDYQYNLLNMNHQWTERLLSSLNFINTQLYNNGFMIFSDIMLQTMQKLGPMWIRMLSRTTMRRHLPIPQYIINQVPHWNQSKLVGVV